MKSGTLFGLTVIALTLAQPGRAQPCDPFRWRSADPAPPDRFDARLVLDAGRGTLLLVGGAFSLYSGATSYLRRYDTWEWSILQHTWTQRFPAQLPPARDSAALAYDPVRHTCLLFGGDSGFAVLADTWEWDGTAGTWTHLFPATSPGPRQGAAMLYSPERGAIVLYGGLNGSTYRNDVWSWDRAARTWVAVPQPSPGPPRAFAGLAPDPHRGTYIMFGGLTGSGSSAETWEWDAATGVWTLLSPPHQPPARLDHAMATDPASGHILVFGGIGGACHRGDLWSWNGEVGDWSELAPARTPAARSGASIAATSSGTVVLYGGDTTNCVPTSVPIGAHDLWEWRAADGSWTEVPSDPMPHSRYPASIAYDLLRARMVLYGPGDDGWTWEWDGRGWHRPQASEPQRANAAIVFDGRRVIMLGAAPSAGAPATTWGWDGQNWTVRSVSGPLPRTFYAWSYDSDRDRVVLFGGRVSGLPSDTWEWNGTLWQQRTPATHPPGLQEHAMAYDPVHQRTVLYGGYCGANCTPDDTWLWDGTEWSRAASAGPIEPAGVSMAFDANRGRVCLTGDSAGPFWEWTGAEWTRPSTAIAPNGTAAALAYDPGMRRLVIVGGVLPNSASAGDQVLVRGCTCYPNCDESPLAPALNVNDFVCFLNRFAAADPYANCDGSTAQPVLNALDFVCFLNAFAAGCP